MRKEQLIVERKKGKTWELVWTSETRETIYRDLFHDIMAKKIHKCTYIKSIHDVCNYDGTRTITVYYDNNIRRRYTIEW